MLGTQKSSRLRFWNIVAYVMRYMDIGDPSLNTVHLFYTHIAEGTLLVAILWFELGTS
jgi:hypothetical protein